MRIPFLVANEIVVKFCVWNPEKNFLEGIMVVLDISGSIGFKKQSSHSDLCQIDRTRKTGLTIRN